MSQKIKSIVFLCIALIFSANMYALSFLHADGIYIKNESNQTVILKGINLGCWALQEGWMISNNGDDPGTQGEMKKKLYDAGFSEAQIETYYANWRNNFIQKADIDYIASKGMNCIRFPMHYELFLTATQRSVRNSVIWNKGNYSNYKNQLRQWVQGNQIATDYTADGYKLIDNLVSWCSANNLYLILDMHAVPGSQGTDEHIADCLAQNNDLWIDGVNQDVLIAIWKNISARYKNEATIAMYEFVNEPNNASAYRNAMKSTYQRLISAVRGNSDNHLLMLNGDGWGNNYTNLTPNQFSPNSNLVYTIHRYDNEYTGTNTNDTHSDPNQLQQLGNAQNFRNQYQVPIFCGETGLTNNEWMRKNIQALDALNIGWAVWSYKWHTNWGASRGGFGQIPAPLPADAKTQSTIDQVLEKIKFANMQRNENQDYWNLLNLKTTPVDPPDNPQPGNCTNQLKGSNMEDANQWKVGYLNSAQGPTNSTWNYQSQRPASGSGGCLRITSSSNVAEQQNQFCIWQQVNLESETYDFDGAFKFLSSGVDRFFLEAFISKSEPQNGQDFNGSTANTSTIVKMGVWNNDGRFDGVDNQFQKFLGSDADKEIHPFNAQKGNYWFVLKIGVMTWNDGGVATKSYDLLLDELSLKARNCPTTNIAESFSTPALYSCNGKIFVRLAQSANHSPIHIYDLTGKLVDSIAPVDEVGISKTLDRGVYLVAINEFMGKILIR